MLQWVHGRAAVVMLTPLAQALAVRSASMGPRPRGRGDACPEPIINVKVINASMGPRPRGRGDGHVNPSTLLKLIRASMGPRPRGRGDANLQGQSFGGGYRFNGSTAARPW